MDFNTEMDAIAGAETGSKYITEPCVALVEVVSYKMSEERPEYKGTPYMEIVVKTVEADPKDSKTSTISFYRTKDGDSDKAREFKLKRMKEFLENAGANFELKGLEVVKSAIGKQLKCLFKQVEYIGKDKNNHNKPEIKKAIEYSFSKKKDEKIEGNQSYFTSTLKEADLNKFKAQLEIWEREHGTTAAASEPGESAPATPKKEEDDLPF
jgi:hypothetical protein